VAYWRSFLFWFWRLLGLGSAHLVAFMAYSRISYFICRFWWIAVCTFFVFAIFFVFTVTFSHECVFACTHANRSFPHLGRVMMTGVPKELVLACVVEHSLVHITKR